MGTIFDARDDPTGSVDLILNGATVTGMVNRVYQYCIAQGWNEGMPVMASAM
ncbi:MAG: hypothetical protein HRT77_05705 [Halioglobus sp.]|nr:hypothetical protein [Halioglobus sp.]